MEDPVIARFARDGRELVVVDAADYDALVARAALVRDVPTEVRAAIADGSSRLAAWRGYRGMTQGALARAAGVSQVWISRIERGEGYGTPAVRARIAAALGVARLG